MFGYISVIFLLLLSSLIPLWSNKLCVISLFKFIEVCFMTQDMIYLGLCSLSSFKKKCILLLLQRVFWLILLLSSISLHSFIERGVEIYYHCGFFYFSFEFYKFLPHMFCNAIVCCIHIWSCCIFW